MKKFAVFGNPISHSISPRLHNNAILGLNLDAFYGRVLLNNGKDLRDNFLKLKLNAANITLPFKIDAFRISDFKSKAADKIGSVNTLVYKNEKFYGYNTDAFGFWRAVSKIGNFKNAVILGAGGTTRAISYILHENGVKFDILNRSDKSNENFECENFYTYENFNSKDYDLVINSTSAGLKDENLPATKEILDEILNRAKLAFDVIYGKVTPFLNLAEKYGLKTSDGAQMLVFQAVLALNLFYDNTLNETKILKFMNEALKLK